MWQYNHIGSNDLMHYGKKGMRWGQRRAKKKQAKELTKKQKQWDDDVNQNWYKAYNKAAEYANAVLIPKLNKKYEGINFNDPKNKELYEKYEKESIEQFNVLYSQKLSEMFGDRPV